MDTQEELQRQEDVKVEGDAQLPADEAVRRKAQQAAVLEEIRRMQQRFPVTGRGPGWGVWQ